MISERNRIAEQFRSDFGFLPPLVKDSREVSAAEYTEASIWFRFVVRVARLLAPVQ